MPHPEREHSLQIELARLQRELDGHRREVVRLGDACLAWGARVDELDAARTAAESERDALRTALQEVNDLLMSVPPGEDWRAVVREKVVNALHGEAAWQTK